MIVKEKDKKYFGRGNPAIELEVVKAEGSFIYGADGKEYIDFLGGAGVGNLGWNVKEIEDAIRNGDRPSYIYPNFYYKPWTELAETLAKLSPGNLKKSYRMTGGSEAVEAALEMATMYTGRKKILSIEGSYHGNTIGALSIGATKKREKFPNLLEGCLKLELPLNKENLEQVSSLLSSKEVAAVIMEPVIINLGVVIPEKDFMAGLDKICKETDTLLIMDEAITGFGRTGKMFASEHFDIEPDILCMAKAITAGHAGMGAVIITEEIDDKVGEKIGLYSSYGWHPVAVDASLAALDYLQKHENRLFKNIKQLAETFKKGISEVNFKNTPEVRIKGAAIGVDLKDEDYASTIKSKAMKKGLLMNTEGSSLLFLPNFQMTKETAYKGIEILKSCV
ncbi:class-III pyridoxal-phosphate-dependent aminotransferase [Salinimicrobium sp. TH3]|uniref:class-III pyridoxal-phosphate-dependent aminotransferase n=1 Tax=Salinimicrobium sp. TH3 TaxID=2997342 RepID=UPI0022732A24|nr:aspartate aminotransferase family protein [Salinimicrobium sp. TH3]MCY2688144.1 aspartate aminotransferase family protein [Salinimicrobium sp. TH3]